MEKCFKLQTLILPILFYGTQTIQTKLWSLSFKSKFQNEFCFQGIGFKYT
jgi:hypothetical protein